MFLEWGYGILTVAIISLCSLVGVAIIPFMDTMIYHKAVVFLISLAVGTLVGDAFLHLFPHVSIANLIEFRSFFSNGAMVLHLLSLHERKKSLRAKRIEYVEFWLRLISKKPETRQAERIERGGPKL